MGCENGCMNETRIVSLENDFKEFKEKSSRDHKEFYGRLEQNEKSMIESQGDRKHIREQLDEIGGDVRSLMQTPAKRYDMITTSVLTGVIGALIGFIMSGIMPI